MIDGCRGAGRGWSRSTAGRPLAVSVAALAAARDPAGSDVRRRGHGAAGGHWHRLPRHDGRRPAAATVAGAVEVRRCRRRRLRTERVRRADRRARPGGAHRRRWCPPRPGDRLLTTAACRTWRARAGRRRHRRPAGGARPDAAACAAPTCTACDRDECWPRHRRPARRPDRSWPTWRTAGHRRVRGRPGARRACRYAGSGRAPRRRPGTRPSSWTPVSRRTEHRGWPPHPRVRAAHARYRRMLLRTAITSETIDR